MSNTAKESPQHGGAQEKKSSNKKNDLGDSNMILAFSNAKEFILDENNSSSNDQTKNHDKLNSDTIASDDFDDKMKRTWKDQTGW